MPPLTSARVVINTRTLRIGGETYSLSNLARVRIVKLAKPARAGRGDVDSATMAGCGFCLFFFFAASMLVGFGWIGPNGGVFVAFMGGPIAIGLGVLIYQKTKTPYIPRYALMLETTGKPKISLISTDNTELERLSMHIANAMENPPEAEQVYTVHNVISGDQYNLVGDHNIGKWEYRD